MLNSPVIFIKDLIENLPLILSSLVNTLQLATVVTITGLLGGIVILYFSLSQYSFVRKLAASYISFFIGTPLLVILFLIYYGLPQYGFGPSAFTVAVICFTLNVSAYNAAYLNSAYRGLDPNELAAAKSQGFSDFQIYRLITLPQVLRTSIPALTNQVIANLKDTAIVFLIGYTDFFARMQSLAADDFQFFNAYLFTAIVYIMMVSLIVIAARWIERHIKPKIL
ncbi:MAG TPA: amino acid ABC transporter permease [Gammaproteobacteria bacterium]|nr:amino acid ABC transporter permease [Gammaproteobacteria bacterium]